MENNMKKVILFAGLMVSVLTFTRCNMQEVESPLVPENTFSIKLFTPETRTVNDGMSTQWEEGDELTVFYAKAGSTSYSANTKFTVTNVDTDLATADLSLSSGTYDWYAFYPYNKYFESPANDNASPARQYIGGRSDKAQTQVGYNSMAHVAGGNGVPLYGIAKGVSSAASPVIQMKHLASLVEIAVTNESGSPITITGAELSAPQGVDIVGQYNISFDGEPTFTKYLTYQSNTAMLSVTGGTALADGNTAKLYLVVKPFEASSLTLKVQAAEGSVEKTLNLASLASFQAGKIKTLNFGFDNPTATGASTIAQILAMADNQEVLTNQVLVVAKAKTALLLKEGSSYILAFDDSGASLSAAKVGDKVVVSGKTGSYSNTKQITSPVVTVKSSGNAVSHPSATDITANFASYAGSFAQYVTFTGVLNKSGNYYNVNVSGVTTKIGSLLVPAAENVAAVDALNGKSITVKGYFLYLTGSNKYVNVISTSVEQAASSGPQTATITVPKLTYLLYEGDVVSLDAETTSSAAISYVSADPSIATVDAQGNVTGVSEGETTITLSVPAVGNQWTAAEKTVTIKVSAKGDDVSGTWKATSLSSIANGAQFVLVSTKDGASYAMSNDKGTGDAPQAIAVTVSGTTLTSVLSNIVWTMEKSGSNYIFHPGSDNTKWLYAINSNDGLRVGTGDAKTLSWNSSISYLVMSDSAGNNRNLGVYNQQDWRCYKVVQEGVANNIKDQTFTFYVKQ